MEPIRITETTSNSLDLFFTSNKTLINKVKILLGISDHETVFIESSLRPMEIYLPDDLRQLVFCGSSSRCRGLVCGVCDCGISCSYSLAYGRLSSLYKRTPAA